MRRSKLVKRAKAWNASREALTRPLTPPEAAAFEKARSALFADPLAELLQPEMLRAALGCYEFEMRVKIVQPADGKSDFGVCTDLARPLNELSDAGLRVGLVKAASVFAARRVMATSLGLELSTMDYFAERFAEHGYLPGRALQLAGWVLAKCNAHLYIQSHNLSEALGLKCPEGKAWLPSTSFDRVLFLQVPVVREHLAAIYRNDIADPKASFRAKRGSSYSEERIWRFFFGVAGVRLHQLELPHSAEHRLRPNARNARNSASPFSM